MDMLLAIADEKHILYGSDYPLRASSSVAEEKNGLGYGSDRERTAGASVYDEPGMPAVNEGKCCTSEKVLISIGILELKIR